MSAKHEDITVEGVVVYCDGCGARGAESIIDLFCALEIAESNGWTCVAAGEFCPSCAKILHVEVGA